ncbi:protein of unknown function [Streptomyces sp. 2131.1]|uniref:DUF397 domain-containing protein n=1 Tax=Streptomyces sp. 2131.1 TaxID=1855346 RepID=UPI00089748EA|nr:DUF397 domain-containing protein [Streptomyces sp. 2131.1]SEC01908.1 protein of unknown function [Streptomyces sp. 2131.1]
MNADRNAGHNGKLDWRKSSYSGSGGGDCVEIAVSLTAVYVRDSKDAARAPFTVEVGSWSRFVGFVAQG